MGIHAKINYRSHFTGNRFWMGYKTNFLGSHSILEYLASFVNKESGRKFK